MSDDDAAQRAWELEMEMAIEGRGRTRSRSILATHDDDDDDNDANASADYTRHHRRHHHHNDDDADENADDYDALGPPLPERAKSGSTERPPVDIVDGGHDPNWLNSPAGDDGGGRSRARSFTAKRTMEMEQDAQASSGASSRRRSRSFSSLNARANPDNNGDDGDANDTEQIVRRATSLSKIYLVGSAPVDVSKLQDESKIVGGKKVEVVEPTGALSSKALDALSEGLQSLSVDKSVLAVGGVAMIPTGSKSGSSLVSEAELEEKRMAEEEDQKLKNQKMSTRKTLSEKASLFKSKVFKTATTKTGSPPATAATATATAKTTAAAAASTAAAAARTTPAATASTATAADATGATAQPVVIKRHKLKLLLLGDSGVGKTSLMRVFSGDEFSESMLATAGVDFKLRHIAVGEDEIALQIWDTAGQERFHRITATYYKGANGIVLVYDVTDRKTFDNVGYWMNNIRQYASPNMPAMLLVGNKIDLPNRVVSSEEGLATAKQYNVRYIETSAKTSENTNGALETIARDAFFMSVNPTMTQKALMEKEKSLLGRRNKENCVIS